jgi:quinol-cytochrome oxidoreductase complex cytochrome b subunit/coenzyme F420-reducing hydrogenase delta subunit/NAD-dependent dihydropyrimidine dehydrogenase PreA subunit
MAVVKRSIRAFLAPVEDQFDRMFSPAWNPFYQLGALGWFFYWIVVISGIYLFIFFDTGITQAFESVEYMTNVQWYAAGIMRSLHRYASDALVVVVIVHMVREFSLDRMRGNRWFAWLTGVPLLWFVYACGITGYWLVWDLLAQYVAIETSEWLDALPFFGGSIAANFADSSKLSARFFTLMVFIHIAVPLIMLLLMWIHIQRHIYAKQNPPRGLAVGTLAALLVLSLVYPATSHEAADLATVPAEVDLDWFYLAAYPLFDVVPGGFMWLVAFGATAMLAVLPWVPPLRRPAIAVVDLENCNGCTRCYDDCPFSAIRMAPRSDGRPFQWEAAVIPANCMSCGICVGACPTATPFRRARELLAGIELPDQPVAGLRDRTIEASAALAGEARVLVYACDHATGARALEQEGVRVVTMPCVAMLPPSFFDFVISRRLADGVFISGCRDGDCHFRLGARWTDQRLARERDPHLRGRVPRERIAVCWAGGSRQAHRDRSLAEFRRRLPQLEPVRRQRLDEALGNADA